MSYAALETYLAPLKEIFAQDGVAEISINKPGEAWIEKRGDMYRVDLPEFDFEHLKGLARLVAQSTEQRISEEMPLLSATLPNGFRIQIVFPPACESGVVVMSIRKGSTLNWDLDNYEEMGAFQHTAIDDADDPYDAELCKMLDCGQIKQFLESAIKWKKKYYN